MKTAFEGSHSGRAGQDGEFFQSFGQKSLALGRRTEQGHLKSGINTKEMQLFGAGHQETGMSLFRNS
jgi:hypothetical protein